MATVKVKFRPSAIEDKEGTVYYQVIHNRVARQTYTGYKLFPSEWNAECEEIIVPAQADKGRCTYLTSMQSALKEDISRIKGIIRRLDRSGDSYTADRVIEMFNNKSDDNGFILFAQTLIKQLRQIGKRRTAETYTSALNSFIRFRNDRDILLEEFDSNLMMEYEIYLKERGVCPNSSSRYMRNLRAIYNRAVDKELVLQRNPFKRVYTGIDKTVKRAVPLKVIKQLKDWDLTLLPLWDYARDMFMFSFYTRGMSFIDMAYLKKKDLQNGVLSYRRQKTNQQLFIKWEKQMQDIINKYDTSDSIYLLPIIRSADKDERRQYLNAAHLINEKLKRMGVELNIPIPLTTYVARHSWASIAKSKNVSVSVISEAMGHDSENTTRIYLASLDTSVVDKANSLILKSL